jgi:hypothetical protein
MSERHWIIAYNELTDECRFMQLTEEWFPFKYMNLEDCQPAWQQVGFYESRYEAYSAFIDMQ